MQSWLTLRRMSERRMWMAGNRPPAGVVREATRLRGHNEAAAGRRRRGACCSGYNLEVHTREGPGRTVLVELDQTPPVSLSSTTMRPVSPQRGWFGRMTLMVVPTPASIKCAAIQRTPREPRKANQLACRSM